MALEDTQRIGLRLHEACVVVREYANSAQHRALDEMLAALEETYKHDLITVTVDGLIAKQASLKQVVALREAMRDSGGSPRS